MLPDIGNVCRQHLQFMRWADRLMLENVQAKLPKRREILDHIYMAEHIWLARIEGTPQPQIPAKPSDLEVEWGILHDRWLALADAGETDWARVIEYRTLAGLESRSPLWQIVLHVANHGSYHRGQIAANLRAAGFTPPTTDLMAWYRLALPAD